MSNEYNPAPPFGDQKNITVGAARVIWVPAYGHREAGWSLPGGLITQDRFKAHAAAVNMNALMGGPRPTDFHALGAWSSPK